MKHIERIIGTIGMIGLLALPLSSCSNENPLDGGGTPRELIVSAEIASSDANSQTRADASSYEKTAFADEDKIYIYKEGEENSKVLYKKSGTRWLPVNAANVLTVNSSNEETFNAFYPFGFTSIQSDQTDKGQNTGTNFAESNKLTASEKTTATGNSVNFKFAPAFCKMTVIVTYQNERSGVTATLKGNGVCTAVNSSETIQMLRTTENTDAKTHTFICIFQPGTRTYTLTVENSTHETGTYSDSSIEFKAGSNYIYNFTSSDELILTGVTVKEFGEGSTIDVGSAT